VNKGLRLGAVQYLNAEPLVWPLENAVISHTHTIVRAVPSKLVRMLQNGEFDCALAPITCLMDESSLVGIPEVAIACRGPVASVLLFHNDPLKKLTTIWLDPASGTSNLLVRILRDRASADPCNYIKLAGDEAPSVDDLPPNTGRLIIGDEALRQSRLRTGKARFSDLGELWRDRTGHPFTFARWIARSGEIAGELRSLFVQARDWSLLHLHELIEPLAEKYSFDPETVDRYLRVNITYMHGPREQAGEREFFLQAGKLR